MYRLAYSFGQHDPKLVEQPAQFVGLTGILRRIGGVRVLQRRKPDANDASMGRRLGQLVRCLRRQLLSSLAFIIAITSASPALSWGRAGHQVVAEVAAEHLSSRTRAEVDRLLALEPGATLASVSTWADEARSPSTAKWHYVNLPAGTCRYVPERDCPDGRCVVGAIEAQFEVLRSGQSDEVRLKAFKYLVHLVADIHQPLHAGRSDDRGGNLYQVRAFGRGTNLHAVWDTALVERLGSSPAELAAGLLRRPLPTGATLGSVASWAEESCKIASSSGFYPTRKVSTEYADQYAGLLRQRLHLAGLRLAKVLNAALVHRSTLAGTQ